MLTNDKAPLTSDSQGNGTWQAGGGGSSPWQTSGNNISNTNSGNVGLGTNSPAQKLDVAGGVAINGILIINSSGQWVGPVGPNPSTDAACLPDYFACSGIPPTHATIDAQCAGICSNGFSIAAGGQGCTVPSDTDT